MYRDGMPLSESMLGHDIEFLAVKLFSTGTPMTNAALVPLGLRVRLYSVLALAGSGARPSQRDVAEFLALDPSQIVALVTELEDRALVVREVDINDRRSNVIVATRAGIELLAEAAVAASAAQASTLEVLSRAERAQLEALLRKVVFGSEIVTPHGNVTE